MAEFTAEDFKNVKFAEHPDGSVAARLDINFETPWVSHEGESFTDHSVAVLGFHPIQGLPEELKIEAPDNSNR